jgi:ankyrin repeat protein
MVALDNFHFDTARVLLDAGANPHRWDWWGRTPLYVAVDMNSYARRPQPAPATSETSGTDIIRLLLQAGVNPNSQLNMHRPGRGGNSSRFVDDVLTTGATPLLRAAIGHDVAAVQLLLEHGALVDLPNVMGVTPLLGAAGMGISPRDRRLDLDGDVQARVVATLELLLAAGADVNARVTDIESRSARIARISTMTDRLGQTALFGAAKFGWARVAELLLAHGADASARQNAARRGRRAHRRPRQYRVHRNRQTAASQDRDGLNRTTKIKWPRRREHAWQTCDGASTMPPPFSSMECQNANDCFYRSLSRVLRGTGTSARARSGPRHGRRGTRLPRHQR